MGVVDYERLIEVHGYRAEAGYATGFWDADARMGFEPLSFAVDEGDGRTGHVATGAQEFGDVVVILLGWGVEDVVLSHGG